MLGNRHLLARMVPGMSGDPEQEYVTDGTSEHAALVAGDAAVP